jgi:hypothetical protein
MAYDTLDPLDSFVDRFRMMCGGDHVIVGPPGSAAQANVDRQVIQVIGPARGQTQGLCVSNWYCDLPHSLPSYERHNFMRETQGILAGLLQRDFAAVEIALYSMTEFARAVEARWPCSQATAIRERLEARESHNKDQPASVTCRTLVAS